MSEAGAESSDDLSGIGGFLFFVFIVHPATAWILRPGRFERRKSIMYAIAFLAGLAAIKTGIEYNAKGPNYYVRLGVSRDSNPLEIKRAYKKLSLQLHPDKNPSPDASDQFDSVKQAYDILMDLELRGVYNKFGSPGISSNKRFDETQFFVELAVFYLTWGMMVFVLTLGKRSGDARQWVFTGMIVMLVLEIAEMTSQENPLPSWLFPQTTEYEAVWLMHSLFPAFMNGCRSLGSFLYVDLEAQTRQLLLALQEQNKDMLLVLRDVQIGVQSLLANGLGGGNTSIGARPSSGMNSGSASAPLQKATPTGKIREIQERLQSSNANVVKAVSDLKSEGKTSSSFGFYAFILAYVLFSFLFNR